MCGDHLLYKNVHGPKLFLYTSKVSPTRHGCLALEVGANIFTNIRAVIVVVSNLG